MERRIALAPSRIIVVFDADNENRPENCSFFEKYVKNSNFCINISALANAIFIVVAIVCGLK
ncbi:MAG: hypothetical protein ACYTFW_14135 [Planctomycetota bacterium]|jgi:hypothetical protein